MFSRAHLLIEKDRQLFLADQPWGIEAHPLTDESIFTWTAKIHGLKQTPWEGGVFRLYIRFDEHYKYRPPVVCFHTIPFHPNIDAITGRPCLDFLDDPDEWSDTITIGFILLVIQNLLSNPVLNSAVNTDAVEMLVNNPRGYTQIVLDCVRASQRVEAGLEPHQLDSRQTTRPHSASEGVASPRLNNRPIVHKLSYTDYHWTWRGLATSKPRPDLVNPQILESDVTLGRIHCNMTPDQLEADMACQLESHNTLMYGKFNNMKKNKDLEQRAKLAKIEKMKKIYLPQRDSTIVPPSESRRRVDPTLRNVDLDLDPNLMDDEADDLVAWTTKLDADKL